MDKKPVNVGGQAVIEGVMMKGTSAIATAVRRPDGEIVYRKKELGERNKKITKIPFLRGGFVLIESLLVGIKELTFSAEQAGEEEEELTDFQLGLTLFLSMAIGVGIFMLLPSLISGFIFPNSTGLANIVEAVLRLVIFITYVYVISFSKDIRRVFQYHGAEHKAIYAFENGDDLTKENAAKYTTLHPRCGTSFLIIVMLCSIVIFFSIDMFLPKPETLLFKQLLKTGVRLALLPFVAGVSYEVQKYTSKHLDNFFVKLLAAPGLKVQTITTKEPDLDQLEVSIVALKAALGQEIDNAKELEEETK